MRVHIPNRRRGFTLIELMISIVLGLLIILGIGTFFTATSRNYREDDRTIQMQDNVRLALFDLNEDLEMAGHWAEFFSAPTTLDASLPVTSPPTGDCGPPGVSWKYDTAPAVEILDDADSDGANVAAMFSCIDRTQVVAGTDIVAIKRTLGQSEVPSPTADDGDDLNRVYMQTNNTSATLFQFRNGTVLPSGTEWTFWRYRVAVYYIRKFSVTEGDGIPSLCREILQGGSPPAMRTESGCIPGIEDLQIEGALDADTDGAANSYVSAPDATEMEALVGLRLQLLARTEDVIPGYTDAKTYTLGNRPAYTPADPYGRQVVSTIVTFRNPSALRQYIR